MNNTHKVHVTTRAYKTGKVTKTVEPFLSIYNAERRVHEVNDLPIYTSYVKGVKVKYQQHAELVKLEPITGNIQL